MPLYVLVPVLLLAVAWWLWDLVRVRRRCRPVELARPSTLDPQAVGDEAEEIILVEIGRALDDGANIEDILHGR